MKIKIITSYGGIDAEIDEKRNPKTAKAVIKALPINGSASRWGDEIYFEIPVKLEEENSQQEVEVGDLAFWVEGFCLCIFFGRTPVSTSEKPKAYSRVNVFGKINDKNAVEILKKVKSGERIIIEKA